MDQINKTLLAHSIPDNNNNSKDGGTKNGHHSSQVASELKKLKKHRAALQHEAVKEVKSLTGSTTGLGKPGFPDAQFLLAEWYGQGSMGLSIDLDKSFSLYLQASKQNHPSSTYRLAVCYELGVGTRKDFAKAAQFYRKACALGHSPAMYRLGMSLIHGAMGLQKNAREGITLLKRAISQGEDSAPHALYELGLLYEGCNNSDEVANIIIPVCVFFTFCVFRSCIHKKAIGFGLLF